MTEAERQLQRSPALRNAVAAERHLIADAGKTADHLTDAEMLDAVVNIGRGLHEVDPELDRWQSLRIAFVGFVHSLPDARSKG